MLTSVPLGWLLLLAAAATVLSSWVLGSMVPLRKFRIAYPVIMVSVGAVMVGVCQLRGVALPAALVLYSCGHIGLAIGMLPQRALFADVIDKWRRGEEQPPMSVPPRHIVFLVVSVIGVSLVGFALTR